MCYSVKVYLSILIAAMSMNLEIVQALQMTLDQTLEHRQETANGQLLQTISSQTSDQLFSTSVPRLLMPINSNYIYNPNFKGVRFTKGISEVVMDSSVIQTRSRTQSHINPWKFGKVTIMKINPIQWDTPLGYYGCKFMPTSDSDISKSYIEQKVRLFQDRDYKVTLNWEILGQGQTLTIFIGETPVMFLNKDAYDQNPESSTIRQSSMIYYHRRPFGNYPLRVKLSSDTAANAGFVVAGMKLIKLLENDLKQERQSLDDNNNYVKDYKFKGMWAKQSPSTSSADPGVEAEVGAGETTTGGTDSVWSGNFKLNQYQSQVWEDKFQVIVAKLDNHGYIEQILSGLKPGDCYSIRIFYYTAISGNPGFQIEINHSPLETDQQHEKPDEDGIASSFRVHFVALKNDERLTIRVKEQGNGIMVSTVFVKHQYNGNLKHVNLKAVAATGTKRKGSQSGHTSGASEAKRQKTPQK